MFEQRGQSNAVRAETKRSLDEWKVREQARGGITIQLQRRQSLGKNQKKKKEEEGKYADSHGGRRVKRTARKSRKGKDQKAMEG